MKSKIEKITREEFNYREENGEKLVSKVPKYILIEKINEIIEVVNKELLTGKFIHAPFNSQSQPEEEISKWQEKRLMDEVLKTTTLDTPDNVIMNDNGDIIEPQDTPEEWEKGLKDCFNVEVRDAGMSTTDIYKEVVLGRTKDYIAELLDEREKESRRDGALAFYTELEDWMFMVGYVKNGVIKMPTKAFMQFVARELKLNNKRK